MRICGLEFTSSVIERVGQIITNIPGLSRRALSQQVCELFNWRSRSGKLQDGNCRKALNKLHQQGVLELPKVESVLSFQKPRQRLDTKGVNIEVPSVCCSLSELGEIEIVPVTSRYCKNASIWRALLDEYHYLESGRLSGEQIRYVIKSSRHGYLGAMAFSAAKWSLSARDKHIGWGEEARIENLRYVVSNDRFLIVPTVRVENLASHVLAMALRRLPEDWYERYQIRPVLVETFVNPTRFSGICYKASNWEDIGFTAGRRDGVQKKILVYALCKEWREILCKKPEVKLGEKPRTENPAHWAEQEFGTLRLYDTRLKERLYTIAQDFYNRPQANIPEACGTKARTLGSYRFFQNEKVTMDVILTPHTEATIERIKEHKVVLAPQDTTTLNYEHPATEGFGPIGTKTDTATGLLLHDTVAFTENGTPLGILDARCWARDPDDKGKSERRKETPIEEKESMKWLRSFRKVAEVQKLCPDTKLVSIGDREADIYELFLEATKDPHGPKLLVRSAKSRQRKVEQEHLWSFMSNLKIAGTVKVQIPKSKENKAREAILDIRFSGVVLTPPKDTDYQPIKVWAVYALESEPVDGQPQIEWMLLTTEPVSNLDNAKQRIEWYSGRWGIEVYHRTLKTGCRTKDRQLGTADRLQACLGVDMVVAWRIYHLTMLGREAPEHPCTVFFEEIEWKALYCYYTKETEPPETPPTVRLAIWMVGIIGGHLGRKRDGMPGTECIWRGLQRLDTIVEMYAIFKKLPLPRIRQFYPYALQPPGAAP